MFQKYLFNFLITQVKTSGVSKLDAIFKNEFSAHAFKIPAEYAEKNVIDFNIIEAEYKSIFETTHFASGNAKENRDKFAFFTLDEKKGNQISKHMTQEFRCNLIKEMNLNRNEITVLLVSENKDKLLEILGKLRLNVARKIDENNMFKYGDKAESILLDPKVFFFLWVVDFPLFTFNEETKKLESTHHPFTAPIKEHEQWLKEMKNLESIIGLHYDLVLNGSEIAGG